MTDEHLALLSLMREFHGICVESGVKYSLLDISLLSAARKIGIRGYEVDVLMKYRDFLKFRKQVERIGNPDREIEGLDNNPSMPGFYFRYVDSSKTYYCLDFARVRKAHGLSINIHILRAPAITPNRIYLQNIEKGMSASIELDYEFNPNANPETRAMLRVQSLKKKYGEEGFAEMFFEKFEKSALGAKPSLSSKLVLPRCVIAAIPAKFLMKIETVTLSGEVFYASAMASEYLDMRYGSKWKSEVPAYRKGSYMNTLVLNVPYKKALPRIERHFEDDAYWDTRRQWTKVFYQSLRQMDSDRHSRWEKTFHFARTRFEQWKRYAPIKEAIMEEYRKGNFDIAWLALKPYRDEVERFSKMGLALSIDDEIWEVLIGLYRLNGYVDLADTLAKQYEEHPLKPIEGERADAFLAKTGNRVLDAGLFGEGQGR